MQLASARLSFRFLLISRPELTQSTCIIIRTLPGLRNLLRRCVRFCSHTQRHGCTAVWSFLACHTGLQRKNAYRNKAHVRRSPFVVRNEYFLSVLLGGAQTFKVTPMNISSGLLQAKLEYQFNVSTRIVTLFNKSRLS